MPFRSYKLNCTANSAHLAHFSVNGLDCQCCFVGSSKTAPRIMIFSIAMGANYSFYMTSIAAYAPAFLRFNNSVLARVLGIIPIYRKKASVFRDSYTKRNKKIIIWLLPFSVVGLWLYSNSDVETCLSIKLRKSNIKLWNCVPHRFNGKKPTKL